MGLAYNGTYTARFSVAEKDAENNREAGVLVANGAQIQSVRVNRG